MQLRFFFFENLNIWDLVHGMEAILRFTPYMSYAMIFLLLVKLQFHS